MHTAQNCIGDVTACNVLLLLILCNLGWLLHHSICFADCTYRFIGGGRKLYLGGQIIIMRMHSTHEIFGPRSLD